MPVLRDADPLDRLNQPIEPTETKPKGKNLETNGKLILKGADGERGWIVPVHDDTGKISAVAAGDGEGFVIFGQGALP